MEVLYLDYNCFQRPFDDPADQRIRKEASACEEIFTRAEAGAVELVWSFVHFDETFRCPFLDRRLESLRLSELCGRRQGPTESIRRRAAQLSREQNLSAKDALHLAAALEAGTECFISCDDRLLHRAGRAELRIELRNPVDYLRRNERRPE